MKKMIKSELPRKITLSVIMGYDEDRNPIKQKLIDVYAEATEVRNASDTEHIVTEYRELITGKLIARSIPDYKYLEFPNFQRYATYTGKLDKTYQDLKVGDIDVELDPGYYLKTLDKDLIEYKKKYDKDTLNSYFDQLDYKAMQMAFATKIDPTLPLSYYNKEEYVFIDEDDLLILKYRNIPEILFNSERYFDNYFYEIVTKRKFAIECGTHNYMDQYKIFHFDQDINTDVLARRLLSEEQIAAYKNENSKVISKRIDNILDRQYAKDRKRIEERKKAM